MPREGISLSRPPPGRVVIDGMSPVGFRDVVGLLLFAVAVAVAATFLDPSKTNGNVEQRPIAHGIQVIPGGDGAGGTPSPLEPSQPLPAPKEWTVLYIEPVPGGSDQVISRGTASEVDFAFSGSPLPGMPADGWRLIVEATVELPSAGRYFVVMEQQGEARVFVDGSETEYRLSPDGPRRTTVTFSHASGPATIRVEATDRGGAFALWIR